MVESVANGLSLWRFENLLRHLDIAHFVSARTGGSSKAPYTSLNVSYAAGDEKDYVERNWRTLSDSLGIPEERMVIGQQTHGDGVAAVSDVGPVGEADALISMTPGVCLKVIVADCVPILLFDPTNKCVAAIHAGRRSTALRIAFKTVRRMVGEYGCRVEDMVAGIGPSIGPCHYVVDDAIVRAVGEHYEADRTEERKPFLDLWSANRDQLLASGLQEQNIEIAGMCTWCCNDLFFSARKEGALSGRFSAGIMLV